MGNKKQIFAIVMGRLNVSGSSSSSSSDSHIQPRHSGGQAINPATAAGWQSSPPQRRAGNHPFTPSFLPVGKAIFIAFILMLMTTSLVFSQYRDIPDVVTKVATAAGNWLKLETNPRAVALGGAFVAAGEGVGAIPYNPAAAAFIEGQEGYVFRTNHIAGITHNVVSYGRKMSGSDFIGVHLFYLDSGPMDVTTLQYSDGTGESFRVQSIAFRTTYGRRLTDRLKVGVSLNFILDEIYDVQMKAMAFDIGSNFDTGIYGFILGMSVTNFGPEVQYFGEGLQQQVPDTVDVDGYLNKVTETFPLPLVFRLGIKNEIMGQNGTFIQNQVNTLTIAIDGVVPNDYTPTGSIGMEYGYRQMAFIRGGLRLGHDTATFSGGGGVRIQTRPMTFVIDYAFTDFGILKLTHQVGLGLEF